VTTINSLFELAIEFRNKGQLRDSVNVLSKILKEYPTDKRTHGIHSVLGGVYSDLGENENALISFKKATQLNPKSELASLGLYVTLAKLDMDEEAVGELIRYLKHYPADLYKDTLKELLDGLKQGHMKDYEDDIKKLARVNGFEI
jgi:tetratricopeptide (TPR) repeat protein